MDAVSSELVSADFPVKQGINREFSQNHPLFGPIRLSNSLVSLVFWVEFPKHRNREYFQRNREFNSWNRELSGWIREPPYGPPQLLIGGPQPPFGAEFRGRTAGDPMTGVDRIASSGASCAPPRILLVGRELRKEITPAGAGVISATVAAWLFSRCYV